MKQTRMANVVRDPCEHPEAVLGDFAHPDPLRTFGLDQVAFVYGNRHKQLACGSMGHREEAMGAIPHQSRDRLVGSRQGDREELLVERNRLIEQRGRIGLRSFWVDESGQLFFQASTIGRTCSGRPISTRLDRFLRRPGEKRPSNAVPCGTSVVPVQDFHCRPRTSPISSISLQALALCRNPKAGFNAAQGDLSDTPQLCPCGTVVGLNARA
jgi:hypothetical protein